MLDPLSSTTRAARLLRLYGWLTLVGVVAAILAIVLPALRDGPLEPRAFVSPAIAAIVTILLFLAGRSLSPRNPKSRYFAGGLCAILLFYFPIGSVLAAFPLYYLMRGWGETGEPDSTTSAGISSPALGPGKEAPLLLRLVVWNAGFVFCLAAVIAGLAVFAERGVSDTVGIWLPYIGGVWLLFLGARFSRRRASVIAIAVIACLLFLFQCGIFGFGIMLSAWNFHVRTQLQLSLAVVVITGVAFVWWFITAKRSRANVSGRGDS